MGRSTSDPFGDWPDPQAPVPVPPGDPTPDYGPPPRSRRRAPWWILGVALVVLVRFGPGWWEDFTGALSAPDRDETGVVVDAGTVSSFELRPGDCFTLSDVSATSVDEAEVVPCGQPHLFEAYAEYVFPGKSREPFPGETAIVEVANDFCFGEFETFVGLAWEDSVLDFVYLYPEPDGWAAGDRVVLCVVAPLEGTLTGSMAGAAR